jgi:hypothetical protein
VYLLLLEQPEYTATGSCFNHNKPLTLTALLKKEVTRHRNVISPYEYNKMPQIKNKVFTQVYFKKLNFGGKCLLPSVNNNNPLDCERMFNRK